MDILDCRVDDVGHKTPGIVSDCHGEIARVQQVCFSDIFRAQHYAQSREKQVLDLGDGAADKGHIWWAKFAVGSVFQGRWGLKQTGRVSCLPSLKGV